MSDEKFEEWIHLMRPLVGPAMIKGYRYLRSIGAHWSVGSEQPQRTPVELPGLER